jgi:hypothetical protein
MLSFPTPACSEIRRELEALALGEVPLREAGLVRRHLERCPACEAAAREVAGLVRQLGTLGPPRRRPAARRAPVALAMLACLAVVVVLDLRRGDDHDDAGAAGGRTYAISGISDLIAAQDADGGWREPGTDRSSTLTVGLSGLATLGCLNGGGGDPVTDRAGQAGCEFLVKTLARNPIGTEPLPPDLQLRAQAAATWALAVAAERWPDRWRLEAARARRNLADLEDRWSGHEGGIRFDDVTLLLVAAARGGAPPGARSAAYRKPAPFDARLLAETSTAPHSGAPLTRLASRVLAEALPRGSSRSF